MALTIGSNIASLQAQRNLARATDSLASISERLSTGQRINHASDDAAGLAIASTLNANVRINTQAIRNINDGLSAANIAEGSLNTLKDISQRQLELATQAANGIYSLTQRQAMNKEANALVQEYNRVVATTAFNGIKLFDSSTGTISLQAGSGSGSTLQLNLSDSLRRAVGDGTFTTQNSPNWGLYAVAAADFNGDGLTDLAFSYGQIQLSNGDGTFRMGTPYDPGYGYDIFQIVAKDFNGDGIVDLLSSSPLSLSLAIGNGNGTFRTGTTVAPDGASTVSVGDLNGDGKLDVLFAELGANFRFVLGNGNGTFGAINTVAATDSAASSAIGDFNGDGKNDFISQQQTTGEITLHLNQGDGTFRAATTLTNTGFGWSLSAADFNNDGKLDFVSANSSSSLEVYIGNGDGSFRSSISISTQISNWITEVADVNGDGLIDIFGGSSTHVSISLNNGDGTFRAATSYPSGGSSGPGAIGLGDFNGDDRLDFVTGGHIVVNGISLANGGFTTNSPYLNINTQQGAREALTTISNNLTRIQNQLGAIGAATSRLQVSLNLLQTSKENYAAASGRIQDADISLEASNLVREKILQKVSASVLTQANLQPRIVLKLLES